LDGPWDNATWKGKKIGVIEVPANAAQETTKFTIDVSAVVDKLDKKHAVYLVAEGGDTEGLFDLIGLGFSSDKKKIVRPIAPSVSIKVNGEEIAVPATPVRSTNANGITGYDIYQTTYKVPTSATSTPSVTASSSDSAVKMAITQADSKTGIAVIKCDYNGVVKTYKVVLSPTE